MVKTSITVLYALTFVSSLTTFALTLTSLFSPNWAECVAIRNVTGGPDQVSDPPNDKYSGFVQMGIIYGYKQFNFGFGPRDRHTFIVFDEYAGVFDTGLLVAVLIIMIPVVVFACVSTVFGFINMREVPIETIHGRIGLYLWNIIGIVCSIVTMSMFVGLYMDDLKYEGLSQEDRDEPNNFYTESVTLGYSFWFVVAGIVLFALNLVFIFLTQLIQEPPKFLTRRKRTADISAPQPGTELGIMF